MGLHAVPCSETFPFEICILQTVTAATIGRAKSHSPNSCRPRLLTHKTRAMAAMA